MNTFRTVVLTTALFLNVGLYTMYTTVGMAQEDSATNTATDIANTTTNPGAPDNAALFAKSDSLPEDIRQIVKRTDENSFFEADISATFSIEQTDPEKATSFEVVRFFRRDSDDKFLLLFEKPETKLGQGYLSIEDGLWFYDPESRQFEYLDEDERIGDSDADSSDFEADSFTDDFDILSATETTLGKFDVWLVALEAKRDDVSPPFLRMWISKDPNLVLKMEEYSLTQRLLSTSYYPDYVQIDGNYIPKRQVFVDNVVEGRTTNIVIDNVSLETIPDNIFTKAYVERVNR